MERRQLGKTGLEVSVLSFGCGAVGGLMTRGEPADQERAVARALELGINYFDSAALYGNGKSEENLGRVLAKLAGRFPRLWLLWADGGYAGALLVWTLVAVGLVIEVVAKPAGATTFAVLPKRWIVERTFAWLGRCRRLSKDYEALPATSEAWIHVAMIHLMLKRLAPG